MIQENSRPYSIELEPYNPSAFIFTKFVDRKTGQILKPVVTLLSAGEGVMLLNNGDLIKYKEGPDTTLTAEDTYNGVLYFRVDSQMGGLVLGTPIPFSERVLSDDYSPDFLKTSKITFPSGKLKLEIAALWGQSSQEVTQRMNKVLPDFFK